jgi:hypothetical protein
MESEKPLATVAPRPPGLSESGWAVLCHLSPLANFFIPCGNLIGPLIVWLIKRDDSAVVDDQGKESLNFQLSVTLYLIAIALFCVPIAFTKAAFVLILAIPIALLLSLVDLILTIVAAVNASNGKLYRYPMSIRFIK